MGQLVDGAWTAEDRIAMKAGELRRPASIFRNWVSADGSAGPTGDAGFKAEAGRYHLYVARACPWAHRTTIMRELKGLQAIVGLSVTHWLVEDRGWTFADGPGVVQDDINNARYLYELYAASDPEYTGRVTVPLLWDKKQNRIVSNESADIIRMFNSAFDAVGAAPGDFYAEALRPEIDRLNMMIYPGLNNGVYRAGMAGTQDAYDSAVRDVFDMLDMLEARLAKGKFLIGDSLTEADIRLFPTLVRFDLVYHQLFKCNQRYLSDYAELWRYAREIFEIGTIGETVNFHHIVEHYYRSLTFINPKGIVPIGPVRAFNKLMI